jgi:hypothetical protein
MKLVFAAVSSMALLMSFCVQSMEHLVLAKQYVVQTVYGPKSQELNSWAQEGNKKFNKLVEQKVITPEEKEELLRTHIRPYQEALKSFDVEVLHSNLWNRGGGSGEYSQRKIKKISASLKKREALQSEVNVLINTLHSCDVKD